MDYVFSLDEHGDPRGMLLEDYFAAAAMQGLLAAGWGKSDGLTQASISSLCLNAYVIASSMLDERADD